MDPLAKSAKSLGKSPLGIIALFIVLVYGLATVGLLSAGPYVGVMVWFLVLFPVLVLAAFVWLLVGHTDKLYAPGDYRDEENFMRVAGYLRAASRKPGKATRMAAFSIEDLRLITRSSGPMQILWVDDHPNNNRYERRAFEAAGIQVLLARSTDEALDRLSEYQHCGAVISDMARNEGPNEGYVLLEKLRECGDTIPLVFYSSSDTLELKQEAERRGGQGHTNDPHELFEVVSNLLMSPSL